MRYFWILFFGTLLLGISCKSDYEKMVERGKGIQQDSLFLGITFGMTSKEFYAHCWDLNKQQLIKQGPVNQTVEYNLDEELRQEGHMYFYPDFHEDKIQEMPVTFSYDAFPWTNEYSLDTLYVDVQNLVTEWYGDLTEFTHPDKGSVLVRVDGNRRIRVFKDPLKNKVKVIFTDLSVEKKEEELAVE